MDIIGPADSPHLLSQQVAAARYFFLDLNPNPRAAVQLAFGGREQCRPDYRISRRNFGYHGLEYVTAGSGWVTLEGRRVDLRAGSVFAYSSDMPCAIGTIESDPMIKYFFCFSGRSGRTRLSHSGVAAGSVRTLENHSEVRTLAEEIIREGQGSSRHARKICATLFDLLLLKLADAGPGQQDSAEPARRNFLRCKALIDADVTDLRTLGEIATRVGLEKSSVCRLFRQFLGTSPYQYLLRQKMNRAAESLLHHGGLVKEVAAQMGYPDPFHFSRGFKAVHGKSPSQLRGPKRTPAAKSPATRQTASRC